MTSPPGAVTRGDLGENVQRVGVEEGDLARALLGYQQLVVRGRDHRGRGSPRASPDQQDEENERTHDAERVAPRSSRWRRPVRGTMMLGMDVVRLAVLVAGTGAAIIASASCGGSVATRAEPPPYQAPDATSPSDDGAGPDVSSDADASRESDASLAPDLGAPCLDDAVAPDAGIPFACNEYGLEGGPTCWSVSQFCLQLYGGQIRQLVLPLGPPGCYAFPCGCGPKPSCACLQGCQCDETDAGIINVICSGA